YIARIQRVAHRRSLEPVVSGGAGSLKKINSQLPERGPVLACRINLEQLELHVPAPGRSGQRFLQYLFRLTVTPVLDVDLRLGQRIDLVSSWLRGSLR